MVIDPSGPSPATAGSPGPAGTDVAPEGRLPSGVLGPASDGTLGSEATTAGTPDPHRDTVPSRFARVAALAPDRLAVTAVDGALTYGELDRWSLAVAHGLLPTADPGRPIAVLAEQSVAAVAALLGVLRAGAPVVVLDPLLPEARLARIVDASGARSCLADAERAPLAGRLGLTSVLDPAAIRETARGGAADLPEPTPSSPASLVYTSGSTGSPKGVVLGHDMVLNGVRISIEQLALTDGDQVALILPYAFAAGQEVLFMALLSGATLHVHDPRLRGVRDLPAWIEDRAVSTLHATPSLLRSLVGAYPEGSASPGVRLLTTCGEPIHGRDVELARTRLPQARFANYLGASETGQLSYFTLEAGEPVPAGVVPAGRPVPGKEIRILDPGGEPVPAGEPGRVQVVSAFLASGYQGDEAATAERFGLAADGRRTYVSGDVGRLDAQGNLLLAGRQDAAVKIRGYLVEPAEVEQALRSMREIVDAVVVAVGPPAGPVRLVAYASPDPRRRTPSIAAVRRAARAALPEWMMPSQIVLLDELPRNERGKVDRALLPEVPPRPAPVPPRGQWEVVLAEIWCRVLDLPDVGRSEAFSELGGDSLAAEEMLAELGARLQVRLTSADLAEAPTLEEFAAVVAGRVTGTGRRRAARGPLVRLRATGDRPPVFCFAGAGGHGSLFSHLSVRLPADQPVYALQVNGLEGRGLPDWSVRGTARRYARIVQEVAPEGPVVLVGHSLGGLFALEVAQLLSERGRDVPMVMVLDTILPPAVVRGHEREVPAVRIPGGRPQTAAELWRTRLLLAGAGWVRYGAERQKDVFFQHGLRLTQFHRPRPWSGATEVYLSNENLDDPAWWGSVLHGPHTVHRVDCDHVALLKDPYVRSLAARLIRVVDDVAARAAG